MNNVKRYNGSPQNDISVSQQVVLEYKKAWEKEHPTLEIALTKGYCHYDGVISGRLWEHKDDPASKKYGNVYFELGKCVGNKWGTISILEQSCLSVLTSFNQPFFWTQRYWNGQWISTMWPNNIIQNLLNVHFDSGKLLIDGLEWKEFVIKASKFDFRKSGLKHELKIGPPDEYTDKESIGFVVPIQKLPKGNDLLI